jgi:hypothetical protein
LVPVGVQTLTGEMAMTVFIGKDYQVEMATRFQVLVAVQT